jgi:hypothetical protein
MGEGWVGVICREIVRLFIPPHPDPLPQEERDFSDGNYFEISFATSVKV